MATGGSLVAPDAFAQQARTFDAIAGSYRIGTP